MQGVVQTFTVPSLTQPGSLKFYLTKQGTPSDNVEVELCAYADRTAADPCAAPASSLLDTYVNLSSVPTWTIGVAPAATTLSTPGLVLYPGITYALLFTRAFYDASNLPILIETPSGYSDGKAYNGLGGCSSPPWVATENYLACGTETKADYDVVFDFLAFSAGPVTVNLRHNGPDVSAYGNCVVPADLDPTDWLFSNLVSVSFEDQSATGFSATAFPACVSGTYDTLTSASSTRLWSGTFAVVATQTARYETFSASATVTVEGSPVLNPSDLVGACPAFTLSDAIADRAAFMNEARCALSALASAFLDGTAPARWYNQVLQAYADDGSSTPVANASISIYLPSAGVSWSAPASSASFWDTTSVSATATVSLLDPDGTDVNSVEHHASWFAPWLRGLGVVFMYSELCFWFAFEIYWLIRLL